MGDDRSRRVTSEIAAPPPPPDEQGESTESQLGAVDVDVPPRDRGTITVVSGPSMGLVARLSESAPFVVGRSLETSLRIDDPGLSRRHVAFTRTEKGFWVEDLGSKNGTYVEGNRIEEKQLLPDGSRLQLGQNTLVRFSLHDELEQEAALQVYEWTMRDPLTGAYNRRYFDDRLREELAFASRHRTGLTILMLDVDHFKTVNDQYGHRAGDLVLSALARFLQRALRTEDVAARYGGEEFVILVRDVGHQAGMVLADRIRRSVQALTVPWEEDGIRITVSVGVASLGVGDKRSDGGTLLDAADKALFRAKAQGRNRVAE